MRSNLIALFIQADECLGQLIAFLELLHRQNIALLRPEQIASNPPRLDGVAHHQRRNAGRIRSDGRVGTRTNEETALRNDIFQFRCSMVTDKNQPWVTAKILVKLPERNAVIVVGPNDMWNQSNIGVGTTAALTGETAADAIITPLRSPAETRRRSFRIIFLHIPFCEFVPVLPQLLSCDSIPGGFLISYLITVPCRTRTYPLFFFCFFGSVEDDLIAVTAVLDGTVDPADGGGACAGLFDDLMKYVTLVQHFCHL